MSRWNPFRPRASEKDQLMNSLSPPDASSARVRRALDELGREPLPPGVATRLASRLEQELPAAPPRRRLAPHGYRRAALAAIVPVAIGITIALAVNSQRSGPGSSGPGAFGALSTAPILNDEDQLRPPTSVAAATASGAPVRSAAGAPAPAETVPAETNAGPAVRPPLTTPRLLGRSPSSAAALLAKRGLGVRFASAPKLGPTRSRSAGYVVTGQRPAAGAEIVAGATVTLRVGVTLGGSQPGVPAQGRARMVKVIGLDTNEAIRRLTGQGFAVTIRGSSRPLRSLRIARQSVAPGTHARRSTVITLRLAGG